uniref:Something about silencing protein 10 n=1 Tax=Aceria tosichella TaxID=561515 RepID=A0A6G1S466_9ACAR
MDSDSEHESIEGEVNVVPSKQPAADWGKTKFNYYFTDYVDKDYPSDLTRKEEREAALEQDEALRLQKKLLATIDNVNLQPIIDLVENDDDLQSPNEEESILEFIEKQNKTLLESQKSRKIKKSEDGSKKRKKVQFEEIGSDECEFDDDDDDGDDTGDDEEDEGSDEDHEVEQHNGRQRRPINMAIKKNRGLTPYKKKEYRNPRVKHKLKYKKAMTKRRRLVKEAKTEFHRYSGESTGIKTSTIRSIKLC